MIHTFSSLQNRIYLLEIFLAACAIVLMLQIGALLEGPQGVFSGNSTYGPPQMTNSVRKTPARKVTPKRIVRRPVRQTKIHAGPKR